LERPCSPKVCAPEIHRTQHDSVELQRSHFPSPLVLEFPSSHDTCAQENQRIQGNSVGSILEDTKSNDSDVAIACMDNHNEQEEETNDGKSLQSTGGASCSFGSCYSRGPSEEASTSSNESATQPIFDVYFGHGSSQSALHPALLDKTTDEPFHDYYYGQELSSAGSDDEELSACQPLYDVYFGLDDGDSSDQSHQGVDSLVDQSTETIPFHDYYFGKEMYLSDAEESSIEIKKVARRIPRCSLQMRPLFTILFGGMLLRSVQAFVGS